MNWNVKDMGISSNGNLQKASQLLLTSEKDFANVTVADAPISNISKAPWKYYGQMVEVSGTVYLIQEYPPGSDVAKVIADGGEVGEIGLIADDGTTYASVFLIGSTGDTAENDLITVSGFPVGQATGLNQLGSETSQLVLVAKK